MYTYIFDDRENEVALNNIKAIIFDVITKEKAKQTLFREQVANNADKNVQQELFALINEQDSSLNDFIFLGNQLGEMLKKVDSCSRNFGFSSENNYIFAQDTDVQKQPINNDLVVDSKPVEKEVSSINENNNTNVNETNISEKEKDNDINKSDTPVNDKSTTSSSIEVIPNADNKEIDTPVKEESESSLTIPNVSDENSNNSNEIIPENKEESNTSNNEDNTDNEKHSSVKLVIPGVKTNDADSSKSDEVKESESPVIPVSTEEDTGNLLIPVTEDEVSTSEIENSVDVDTSSSSSQDSSDDENDSMLDALLANDVKPEEEKKPVLKFKKRNNDLARAILTSGKQTSSLRKSRDTQEALLSSRGFSVVSDASNLEQQLVDNGLLPADNESQMENMLNQANELYAAGKVEEAQAMYDKISELNKQLQGGAKAA